MTISSKRISHFILLLALLSLVLLAGWAAREALAVQPVAPEEEALLCRFGVNHGSSQGSDPVTNYDLSPLRAGWYISYNAVPNPPRPNGIEYTPIISLSQEGEDGYSYSPSGSALEDVVAGNPGAHWYIGNEPDRRYVQNDIEPHLYAQAYHELYHLIKGLDPAAKIIAGTIVQGTPVRILYLDMVYDSYYERYGRPLPADGWSMHGFILNEVNDDRCEEVPDWVFDPAQGGTDWGCSGAGIPPGIDWLYGELVQLNENDSMELFTEFVVRMRQWMADHGYRNLPLYLSEYGVLVPEGFEQAPFPPERVNAFMDATFTYLRDTTDPSLGYAYDDYRLVQRFSWYSTADDLNFNGYLYNPLTKELSEMGANYAAYVADLDEVVDLYPARLAVASPRPLSHGENVSVTLEAVIANSGNLAAATELVDVRFFDGDPAGGQQIGATQTVALSGCGEHATVSVLWPNVSPGTHLVSVQVAPAAGEIVARTANNTAQETILIPTYRSLLPTTQRPRE